MNRGGRTKPDQWSHVVKLFFQIPRARTLVTTMGQPVFQFPTKGYTSAEIRYFELIWVLGDLHEIYMTPSVRAFRIRLVTLPNTPDSRGAGLIANESLSLTPAEGES